MLKLISKKPAPQTGEVPLFLAILLLEGSVQTVLWTIEDGEIAILTKSTIKAYHNDNDCLTKTDEALQELGPESEDAQETIFVFEPDWIAGTDLKADKKPLVKKVTQDLSLKPLGFVVSTEALAQHFMVTQTQEDFLLLYFAQQNLNISLFEHRKLVAEVVLGQCGKIENDLLEGLAQIKNKLSDPTKIFPNKIYLASLYLSEEKIQAKQQELIIVHFDKKYFPQTPLVEVFEPKKLFRIAVEEAGKVVAGTKRLPLKIKSVVAPDSNDKNAEQSASQTQMSSFGVPITNKYIMGKPSQPLKSSEFELVTEKKPFLFAPAKDNNALPVSPVKKMILLGVGTGIMVFLLLAFMWLKFFSKITITIVPQTQLINKDLEITLDPKATQSDPEKLILKAKLVTQSYTQKGLDVTTGEKTIGEKAKGKVTIFNKTTEVKTFESGTQLVANGLTFSLDETVKVASASVVPNTSGDGETKEYGKAQVSVTAVKIGQEGNLNKDTALKVANYGEDTYSAVVAETLTGGESKDVQVVTAADKANLAKTVQEEIKKQAKLDFEEKSNNGIHYILTNQIKVDKSEYDHEIDTEAETLNLTLTATVTAVEYSKEDLKPLAQEYLTSLVPAGFKLVDKNPEILSSPKESSQSSKVVLEANLSSEASAVLDSEAIQAKLVNLAVTDLANLKNEFQIKSISYQFEPSIAEKLVKQLPSNQKRLSIIIKD